MRFSYRALFFFLIEIEDEDSDVYAEEGLSDETRVVKVPVEESTEVSPPSLPLLQHHQQLDPIIRPPIPGSTRPHVQIQQYGRHDTGEEHSATRPSRPSRLSDPHEEAPLSPARSAQPPRRIVPQAPEEQEQEEEAGTDDELVPSHLFARSSVQARDPVSQHPGGEGQPYEADDDGDVSENDTLALPVRQRTSMEVSGRSIPPPVASPSHVYEPNSDHDGQVLPVRPRHTAVPPIPPTPVIPRPTPQRSVPSAPENEESFHGMPSVAVSEAVSGEILDEEEGGKCLFSVTKFLF